MSDIVAQMRSSRKSPSVLRLRVLQVRGDRPDLLIFLFEGQDDIAVYEEWIKRIDAKLEYEPISATGKEQVVAFCDELVKAQDPLLRKLFFFVDRDFDEALSHCEMRYELKAHSIETLLCKEDVLENLLMDEFRLNGQVQLRSQVATRYLTLLNEFRSVCEPINFQIFVATRRSIDVVRKPEKVSEIADVTLCSVTPAYHDSCDLVELREAIDQSEKEALEAMFLELSLDLRSRGKYCLDFFRKWIRLAFDDAKSLTPVLFEKQITGLKGDPSQSSLRRLASASSLPDGLDEFIERVKNYCGSNQGRQAN